MTETFESEVFELLKHFNLPDDVMFYMCINALTSMGNDAGLVRVSQVHDTWREALAGISPSVHDQIFQALTQTFVGKYWIVQNPGLLPAPRAYETRFPILNSLMELPAADPKLENLRTTICVKIRTNWAKLGMTGRLHFHSDLVNLPGDQLISPMVSKKSPSLLRVQGDPPKIFSQSSAL